MLEGQSKKETSTSRLPRQEWDHGSARDVTICRSRNRNDWGNNLIDDATSKRQYPNARRPETILMMIRVKHVFGMIIVGLECHRGRLRPNWNVDFLCIICESLIIKINDDLRPI